MPSLKDIRDRIRSVSNTAKITSAMQLIAASRMQRAQQMVRDGRPYADHMREVISHLSVRLTDDDSVPDLLRKRDVERSLMVLVSPDRGLAGALVSNILRAGGAVLRDSDVPVDTASVGRKGERFIARSNHNLVASFAIPDRPSLSDTFGLSSFVMDRYRSGDADRVVLVYAQFVNTAVQKPVQVQLLPVESEPSSNNDDSASMYLDYIYEPSAEAVLSALVPRYVETQIYHAILEAQASEHSARMIAMRNATDNANELIEELTLDLNKARQESITGELLDIVGGVAGVEG